MKTEDRIIRQIIVLLVCLTLSGCVPVMIQKEIQVRKDAEGKIIETTEIERATQKGSAKQLQFDYLKRKNDDAAPAVIYSQ